MTDTTDQRHPTASERGIEIATEHFLAFDERHTSDICSEAANTLIAALHEAGLMLMEREHLVVIDEALDILPNPYVGEPDHEAWADFIHAKDMLDAALNPTGDTAQWLGIANGADDGGA